MDSIYDISVLNQVLLIILGFILFCYAFLYNNLLEEEEVSIKDKIEDVIYEHKPFANMTDIIGDWEMTSGAWINLLIDLEDELKINLDYLYDVRFSDTMTVQELIELLEMEVKNWNL